MELTSVLSQMRWIGSRVGVSVLTMPHSNVCLRAAQISPNTKGFYV
jgi:hypothetical protein